jgi:hypothetical protein
VITAAFHDKKPMMPKTVKSQFQHARTPVGDYAARHIRFLRRWEKGGTTFKVYGITMGALLPTPGLIDAALLRVARHLKRNPTRHRHYGVGFISLHEGRGENQIIVDRWINENELLHEIYVSSPAAPAVFRRPARDHNCVCVWELYLQSFERKAWLRHVLGGKAAWPQRLKRYLEDRLDVRA